MFFTFLKTKIKSSTLAPYTISVVSTLAPYTSVVSTLAPCTSVVLLPLYINIYKDSWQVLLLHIIFNHNITDQNGGGDLIFFKNKNDQAIEN